MKQKHEPRQQKEARKSSPNKQISKNQLCNYQINLSDFTNQELSQAKVQNQVFQDLMKSGESLGAGEVTTQSVNFDTAYL